MINLKSSFFEKKFINKHVLNKSFNIFLLFDFTNISLKVMGGVSLTFLVIHGCLIACDAVYLQEGLGSNNFNIKCFAIGDILL